MASRRLPSAAVRPRNVIKGPLPGVGVGVGVPLATVWRLSGSRSNIADKSATVTNWSPLASTPRQLKTEPPSTSEAWSPSPSASSWFSRTTSAVVTSPSQSASPGCEGGAPSATFVSHATQATSAPNFPSWRRYSDRPRTDKDGPLCPPDAVASMFSGVALLCPCQPRAAQDRSRP
jgi:hypothetical protein